jgi:predicted TIM-barrel fold metal-dependent hydrolase
MVLVANAFLERADAEEQLGAHAERSPRLRGIRQMLDRDPWTGAQSATSLMGDPGWLRGLSLLGPLGLVFDLQVLPGQLPQAARVAADQGDLTFVLNHGGYHVPASAEAEEAWRHGVSLLARCPNVVVKASGWDTVDPAWAPDGVDRYLGTLLEAFGPERVLFASNFPVDRRTVSFSRLVELDLHAVRHLTAVERDQFFCLNAARVYRIPLDPSS